MKKQSGRLDVFQVDAAEGRLQRGDHVDQLVEGSRSLTSMSNTSMPANFLNSTALPSITGLAASGPMAPRPEHGGAVGEHRDKILPRRQPSGLLRIGLDRLAGEGDARRIGEREVALVGERLGRGDLQLARAGKGVEVGGRPISIRLRCRWSFFPLASPGRAGFRRKGGLRASPQFVVRGNGRFNARSDAPA